MPPRKKAHVPKRTRNRNAIGGAVRKIREAQNITRGDVAARAQVAGWDISEFAVKRIETGEREVTDIELRQIARALRVHPAVLLD